MPDPKERKIEQWLKTARAKRLQEAGTPEMHPAMREILQTEVRRHYEGRKTKGLSGLRLFWRWLPRTAALLALAASAWLLFVWKQEEPGVHLAMQQPAPASAISQTEPKESPDLANKLADTPTTEKGARGTLSPTPVAFQPATLPPPKDEISTLSARPAKAALTETPKEISSKSVAGPDYFKADRQGMYMGTAMTEADKGVAATLNTGMVSVATGEAEWLGSNAEVARSQLAWAQNAAPPPVLQNFTLVNEGTVIRLIDADGSTYAGQLQLLEQTEATRALAASGRQQVAEEAIGQVSRENAPTAGEPLLSYRVTAAGTNRSLGQSVQFSGNLLLSEQQLSLGRNRFYNARDSAAVGGDLNKSQPASPLTSGRLRGVAVLGDGKDIPVDAVPASIGER